MPTLGNLVTLPAYLAGIDWFSFYCLGVGLAAGWALRTITGRRRLRLDTNRMLAKALEQQHEPCVGEELQVELPGWGETVATVEAIDADGTIWVSDRDGKEWEL